MDEKNSRWILREKYSRWLLACLENFAVGYSRWILREKIRDGIFADGIF